MGIVEGIFELIEDKNGFGQLDSRLTEECEEHLRESIGFREGVSLIVECKEGSLHSKP